MEKYAKEFSEIKDCIVINKKIKQRMIKLINIKRIYGYVVEEENRERELKLILEKFCNNDEYLLNNGVTEIREKITRSESKYSNNNNVFRKTWENQLLKNQISRFYNQAVLEILHDEGDEKFFVYPSKDQDPSGKCSIKFINKEWSINEILVNIERNYDEGKYDNSFKLPEHVNCSHVASPITTKKNFKIQDR